MSGHPKDRAVAPDDPMLLVGQSVEGDPEFMLRSLVEEFARMGFDADHVMTLFESRFFQATWGLRERLGEDAVRQCVEDTLRRCGVARLRTEYRDA